MSVRSFITEQPSPQREIMTILRSWIMDLGPHTQEKISYSIPYFHFYGQLCYLNPVKDGVDLGFNKGYELSNDEGLLETKGRKHVKSITFYSVAELEEREDALRHLLNEAAILNEYRFKQTQKKKKTS
ncbi:DUF1801 domain-containing protein [Chryseolinea lacunae]|uniref:DUF1801 domain-containing protein n=1 Tax=Chryseolinea lacunae TaxID=2801331 RepID=A0ABS1KRE8_9BACT|nr:DUF1801 domain-containing protein [Chryseolinea lacunae]MBL0742050.1 DUF1801 domain-containing protein [Chryseolinea lacunae]